ncbi:MAG: pitrilysin family protein [Actinomycetota bacterium]|nr:pitrilysin family protein [Actinomycetota bacterium]
MTVGPAVQIPGPGPYPSVTLGDFSDTRMPNGMRVIAVRRPQVPLVQLRLQIPLGEVRVRDSTALRLLPKMLLAGSGTRSGSEMAVAIQRLGASVDTWADPDHLALAASAPRGRLAEILELLADIVAHPSFPPGEVAGERDRVAQEVLQEAADPVAVATRALEAALYPGHPYADPLPGVASVRRTSRGALRSFHEARVRPRGSSLVVVGDVDPGEAGDAARHTLGAWSPGTGSPVLDALEVPRAPTGGRGILVVHRPGAVQSNLRIGARCGGRHDPAFPALLLAMTIFGGSFTSRLVTNLRERNGYTYSPRAGVDEHRRAAAVSVGADVATEVTARALTEVRYELARMATAPVTPEELESSRRYVTGVIAMSSATQAGLASVLANLVGNDLDPPYLETFIEALARVDTEAVSDVAARSLGPAGMTTVVVGDADAVTDALSPLDRVKVIGR